MTTCAIEYLRPCLNQARRTTVDTSWQISRHGLEDTLSSPKCPFLSLSNDPLGFRVSQSAVPRSCTVLYPTQRCSRHAQSVAGVVLSDFADCIEGARRSIPTRNRRQSRTGSPPANVTGREQQAAGREQRNHRRASPVVDDEVGGRRRR